MRLRLTRRPVWLICLASLAVSTLAFADDEDEDEKFIEDGRSCINGGTIRRTTIIDDANILFYVRGNRIYRNMLPRRCNGLAREGRFSYRRSSSSLCQRDFIQVLMGGATGMQGGAMCPLGRFYEVSKSDVELLKNPAPVQPPPQELPSADPEDVIESPGES